MLLLHYLGLHEKCELAQLALLNITTFDPSETLGVTLGKHFVSSLTCGDNPGGQTSNFPSRDRVLSTGALRPAAKHSVRHNPAQLAGFVVVLRLSSQAFIQSISQILLWFRIKVD